MHTRSRTNRNLKDKSEDVGQRKASRARKSQSEILYTCNPRKRKRNKEWDCDSTNAITKQQRTTQVHVDKQKTATKPRTPINKPTVRKPKWNLPKMIQPKAADGNKHTQQKLASSNQKANTVIAMKQKPKKLKLLTKSDNNQKKKTTPSTRNESKLSPRRNAEKNKKSTPSKGGKQESLKNTRRSSQKKVIRLAQDQGAIEKKKVAQPRTTQKRKSRDCHSSRENNITPKTGRKRDALDNKKTRRNLQNEFGDMFLKKVDVKTQIPFLMNKRTCGISVTHDNQVWVNYEQNHVKLFSASGDELRSFDLENTPIFNCCTPNGDLLVTQGYAANARAEVQLIPREGTGRMFADLSSYADFLCGVCYQDEKIYVLGDKSNPTATQYFVLRLDMNGEVEEVFETTECRLMNHLISHHGQIFAMRTSEFAMLPLDDGKISLEAINRVRLKNTYSASASVDNLGNVIVASVSKIIVINPSLEHAFKIDTDIQAYIHATAVDQHNQLWIGTHDGNLFIVKYLR